MGAANLARARELSWDKIAKQTAELYLKLRSKNVFLRAPSGIGVSPPNRILPPS
jgi:hypothetical protein